VVQESQAQRDLPTCRFRHFPARSSEANWILCTIVGGSHVMRSRFSGSVCHTTRERLVKPWTGPGRASREFLKGPVRKRTPKTQDSLSRARARDVRAERE